MPEDKSKLRIEYWTNRNTWPHLAQGALVPKVIVEIDDEGKRTYHLPKWEVPQEENMLDLGFMEKYVGNEVDFWLDGKYQKTTKLMYVEKNTEGIWCFELED